MTRHVHDRLSAYVDGDLGAPETEVVRAHLDACAGCRAEAEGMRGMVASARRLERPDPPASLWPAIEGELARSEGWRGRLRPYAVGALVGAGAILASFAGWQKLQPRESVRGAAGTAPTSAAVSLHHTDPLLAEAASELRRAAAEYERSIQKLRDLLAREESGWNAETRARMAERLARLDEAIARSGDVVRRLPADSVGHEVLFSAYQRKIEFLTAAVHRGMPAEAPGGWR